MPFLGRTAGQQHELRSRLRKLVRCFYETRGVVFADVVVASAIEDEIERFRVRRRKHVGQHPLYAGSADVGFSLGHHQAGW